jgi:hypothetical protein
MSSHPLTGVPLVPSGSHGRWLPSIIHPSDLQIRFMPYFSEGISPEAEVLRASDFSHPFRERSHLSHHPDFV